MVLSQIRPLLGVGEGIGYREIISQPTTIQPSAVIVGLATLISIVLLRRYVRGLPAPFVGMTAGTVLCYAFQGIKGSSLPIAFVGSVHFEWPLPDRLFVLQSFLGDPRVWSLLPQIILSGCLLGLLGSLESLLSSRVADDLTGERHAGDRELVGQGVGNMVCSWFGAPAASGSMVRTVANIKAGGRTRWSGMMCSLLLFLVVGSLTPLLQKLPMAGVAGVMIAIASSLFDGGSLRLRMLRNPRSTPRNVLNDLLVTLTVAFMVVVVNVAAAAALGTVLASLLFVTKMGQSVIRTEYTGSARHSRKSRSSLEQGILDEEANRVVVLELQGALFFASAEIFARKVEMVLTKADFCIIELKQISEIDSTGLKILMGIKEQACRHGKNVFMSYLAEEHFLRNWPKPLGVTESDGFFPDTDAALECAEDLLLGEARGARDSGPEPVSEQMDIVRGFTLDELGEFRRRLEQGTYRQGSCIIREGELGQGLFILMKGSVTVNVRLQTPYGYRRCLTLRLAVCSGKWRFLMVRLARRMWWQMKTWRSSVSHVRISAAWRNNISAFMAKYS